MNYWGFTVHHIKSGQFIENARAVFEEVKTDKSIKKIIFTRDNTAEFGLENSENTIIIKLMTIRGLRLMLKCKVLFVTHSISMDYSCRYGNSKFSVLKLNMTHRVVVNLWHGIAIKKLYALWNPLVRKRLDRVKFRRYERTKYSGLIVSSDVDSYAMATMFYPIKYENIWMTGLPRNDFLRKPYDELPKYLRHQIDCVRKVKGTKKLVVYAPTYRQNSAVSDAKYYQFSKDEIDELKMILENNNAILGVRLHYFNNSNVNFNIVEFIDNELIVDLGHKVSPEIAPVIREADLVLSDYSSVFTEAIYVNRPVISFAYDFEHYRDHQDGILYDFKMTFPGEIVKETDSLFVEVEKALKSSDLTISEKYKNSQKFFYNYLDKNNSKRVVQKVLSILDLK